MSDVNNFSTSLINDNEIVKASDFQYGFESVVNNTTKLMQMLLSSDKDFVINGTVIPAGGMTVKVKPIFGVCHSTGLAFGSTDYTPQDVDGDYGVISFTDAKPTTNRIDIVCVSSEWETYDNQARSFYELTTESDTIEYKDTKKRLNVIYKVIEGSEGSVVAPATPDGYVKLAEVHINAGITTITESLIKNITAKVSTESNDEWTNEEDSVFNLGYLSETKEAFNVEHNSDGSHADECIGITNLKRGINSTDVNGNGIPTGKEFTINTVTHPATDGISTVLEDIISTETDIYSTLIRMNDVLGFYALDNSNVIYAATTENITSFNGIQTIDGVVCPVDSLVLVKDCTDETKNGIWRVSTTNWDRTKYPTTDTITNKLFEIQNGNTNKGHIFYCNEREFNSASFGTESVTFSEYLGSIIPLANKAVVRDSSGHVKAAGASSSNDCVIKSDLLNLIYPIGSLYWSTKSTNPKELFGGTWKQIKDTFVMAAGDTYTANGGNATATLTTDNLPAHSHSFTPYGSVSSHTHIIPGHTHDFEAKGTVSSNFEGELGTTSDANPSEIKSDELTGFIGVDDAIYAQRAYSGIVNGSAGNFQYDANSTTSGNGVYMNINAKHTHTFTPSGKISSEFYGSANQKTDENDTFESESTAPDFNGTRTNTENTGNGKEFSILPPYKVAYCWERTA